MFAENRKLSENFPVYLRTCTASDFGLLRTYMNKRCDWLLKTIKVKVPLQANFFISDIKSRHDFYRTCPNIFLFGQIVHILWPFKVAKSALSDDPCPLLREVWNEPIL